MDADIKTNHMQYSSLTSGWANSLILALDVNKNPCVWLVCISYHDTGTPHKWVISNMLSNPHRGYMFTDTGNFGYTSCAKDIFEHSFTDRQEAIKIFQLFAHKHIIKD